MGEKEASFKGRPKRTGDNAVPVAFYDKDFWRDKAALGVIGEPDLTALECR